METSLCKFTPSIQKITFEIKALVVIPIPRKCACCSKSWKANLSHFEKQWRIENLAHCSKVFDKNYTIFIMMKEDFSLAI